jgi:cysteinyl-tRNA synthetase, unknown class
MRARNMVLPAALFLGCSHHAPMLSDTGAPSVRGSATPRADAEAPRATLVGPGFPDAAPWVSFYGSAAQMGDVAKVAATYRIINIDADPEDDGVGNFTDAQLATLKAGGKNRVLSYLNLGSCERSRTYWSKAPAPLVPCSKGAQLGAYQGYPDEVWMNVGDPDYQALILEHVAARIAARGVDGLYLDNLEIVEHGLREANGPCDTSCQRGGLELVAKLRERYPSMLLVMQNATSEVTRTAVMNGIAFPLLLDGIAHEEVYAPTFDANAERELLAWQAMKLTTENARPLWIGVEDYAGSCTAEKKARAALGRSQARGFSGYVSDASAGQKVVCYWP